MRSTYLVAYDIADAKRLRLIHKKMSGFGDWVQYSVFLCELSDRELALLREALHSLVHMDEDQVMIIRLGPSNKHLADRFEFIGRAGKPPHRDSIVV